MDIEVFRDRIADIIKSKNWSVPVHIIHNKREILSVVRVGTRINGVNFYDDYSFKEISETESEVEFMENAIFNLEKLYMRLETIKKSEEMKQDVFEKLKITRRF